MADPDGIVPLTPALLVAVARTMRSGDRWECQAHGMTPLQALETSWAASQWCGCLMLGGSPAAAFGLVMPPGGLLTRPARACAWLLSTTAVEQRMFGYHRAAKRVLADMLTMAGEVECWVDARYLRATRWLVALGGKVVGQRSVPPAGYTFLKVVFGGAHGPGVVAGLPPVVPAGVRRRPSAPG